MPKDLTRWYLPIYLLLNSLALVIAGLAMLAANAGFQSNARATLTTAVFVLAGLVFFAGLWFAKRIKTEQAFGNKGSNYKFQITLNLVFGLFFALTWGLAWLPAQKTGTYYYYFIGIQPLLAWAAFASGLALLFSLTLSKGFSLENGLAYWRRQKTTLRIALIALVIFGLVAAVIAWLKIWASNEPYWYGAGVPLLIWQLYVLMLAAVLLRQIRFDWPRHTDVLLFFVIWGVSAYFWINQPLQSSFFFTPPLPPNNEFYPFADLETFDRASQYALIGQGINNGIFFDRTLYIAFLVYLHTFFGQNYELLMKIQAGLLAVFPAVIYLIAKTLHSRPAGLISAALVSWRGINALAAMAWIDTSTAKHMLTDFPTALGLAIFCLFLIQWIKDPKKNWYKAALGAGTLGLTSLLRPHVMAILVVFLPLVILVARPKWRQGLAVASLGFLVFFASISPWMFFSGNDISIIDLYATRIRNVIKQRYIPPEQAQTPTQTVKPVLPVNPVLPPAAVQSKQPVQVPFQVNHFFNNLQTSALGLPLAPQLLNIRETVKSGETVWQSGWQGTLSHHANIMLWIGLGLTALGIGSAVQKSRWAGVALPAVFLIYSAANALSRTSGGRYLVPMDWIMFLFFGLGLAVLLEAGQAFFNRKAAQAESAPPAAGKVRQVHWAAKAVGILALFGLIGGLIPFSQTIHPLRYQPLTQDELLDRLSKFLPETGLNKQTIAAFLQDENAALIQGAALYPRFLYQGEGFPSWPPYEKVEYPRTIFVLIGPQLNEANIVLPGPNPQIIPHDSDVIVLGCSNGVTFDALLVVLNEQALYKMQPERPLECPVHEPICNNNKKCQ